MGGWSSDIDEPASLEGILTDGDRYVQYRAVLETADTDTTPTLEDITLDWGYTDVPVFSFKAESRDIGISVSWECSRETVAFNLYRSAASGNLTTVREKLNPELIVGSSPYEYLDSEVKKSVTYNYWLEAVDDRGSVETTYGPAECTWLGAVPGSYALHRSQPNPARGTATITFDLPEQTRVTLAVYDTSGRRVATLVDRTLPAGEHEVEVSGLTPGVYIYRLRADGADVAARKMVIVK